MYKIDEREDLSRKVLEIDIESPIFSEALKNLNSEIQRVIGQVFNEEFESGEITLKLSIEIPEGYETVPKQGEPGELLTETFKYRKPFIKHNVSTTLKKQYKKDGVYTDKRDIQFKNGKYVAVPIKEAQMKLFEADMY